MLFYNKNVVGGIGAVPAEACLWYNFRMGAYSNCADYEAFPNQITIIPFVSLGSFSYYRRRLPVSISCTWYENGKVRILDRRVYPTQVQFVECADYHVVDGTRKPSSEWALHTIFYKNKPEAGAVVHTHSVYCTTFAVLGQPIRAVHYVIGDANADEVPCAPYQTFGTVELAEAAIKVCGQSNAVLLGNHGLVVCGRDIKSAYSLACNMEYIAELQYRAMVAWEQDSRCATA